MGSDVPANEFNSSLSAVELSPDLFKPYINNIGLRLLRERIAQQALLYIFLCNAESLGYPTSLSLGQ